MAFSFRKLVYAKKLILASATGRINVHFLHIRKTGGTAIKSALASNQITPVAVLHLHPHRIRLHNIPYAHYIMFCVRDPVARYVSGFNSRLRKGAPAHDVPWTPDEALAFSRFQDANSLALALDPSHEKHAEAVHAMKSISHVGNSYWDWFGDEETLHQRRESILFIGQIETFESDFELLKRRLQLPSGVMLPLDAKSSNRAETRSSLEPRAIQLVKAWYQRDYDFLEFCGRWRCEHGGPIASG